MKERKFCLGCAIFCIIFSLKIAAYAQDYLSYSGKLKVKFGGELKNLPVSSQEKILQLLQLKLPKDIELCRTVKKSNSGDIIGTVQLYVSTEKKTKKVPIEVGENGYSWWTKYRVYTIGTKYKIIVETIFNVDTFSNWYLTVRDEDIFPKPDYIHPSLWNNIPAFKFFDPKQYSHGIFSISYFDLLSDGRYICPMFDNSAPVYFFEKNGIGFDIELTTSNNINKLGFGLNAGADILFSQAINFNWTVNDTINGFDPWGNPDYDIESDNYAIEAHYYELDMFFGPAYTFPLKSGFLSMNIDLVPGLESVSLFHEKSNKLKSKYLFQASIQPSIKIVTPPLLSRARLSVGLKGNYNLLTHKGVINFKNRKFEYGSDEKYSIRLMIGFSGSSIEKKRSN